MKSLNPPFVRRMCTAVLHRARSFALLGALALLGTGSAAAGMTFSPVPNQPELAVMNAPGIDLHGSVWMRCAMGQTWDSAAGPNADGDCTGTATLYTWANVAGAVAALNAQNFGGRDDWVIPANPSSLFPPETPKDAAVTWPCRDQLSPQDPCYGEAKIDNEVFRSTPVDEAFWGSMGLGAGNLLFRSRVYFGTGSENVELVFGKTGHLRLMSANSEVFHQVLVSTDGNGSVDAVSRFQMRAGALTFVLTPNVGHVPDRAELQSGTCILTSVVGNVLSTTVGDSDCHIAVRFKRDPNVWFITNENALLLGDPAGTLSCPPTATAGQSVQCTFVSAPNYQFTHFTGCDAITETAEGAICHLNAVAADRSVRAVAVPTYSVSATPDASQAALHGGSVSCTPNPVMRGGAAVCTAQAEAGHVLQAWGGDCSGTPSTSTTCQLSDVRAAQQVSAQFEAVLTHFSGTTVPSAQGTAGVATASFTGGGAVCRFALAHTAFVAAPTDLPHGQTMPHGMLQFKLIGCDASPVRMRITWPNAVTGLSKWGLASEGAAPSHFQPTEVQVNGATTEFTVQDGQLGDDDWRENGEIVDPVGATRAVPVVAPHRVPGLEIWGLSLLALLAAVAGGRQGARKRGA